MIFSVPVLQLDRLSSSSSSSGGRSSIPVRLAKAVFVGDVGE